MKRIPSNFIHQFNEMRKVYLIGLVSSCGLKCDDCAMQGECSVMGGILDAIEDKLALLELLEECNAD